MLQTVKYAGSSSSNTYEDIVSAMQWYWKTISNVNEM